MAVVYWCASALLVLVALVSLDVLGFFSRGNHFQVDGQTVLLTGASQGMGRELAKQLSQRGANVVLVARDVAKLRSALEYAQAHAKKPSRQRFHYISADVTSEQENTRLLAEATAWNHGKMPEVVWANAGSSIPGLFVETAVDTLRKQMDLNYWAAVYLAHKTLRAWLYPEGGYERMPKGQSEKPRTLILTSSSVAFVNVGGYTPYGPAKTALRALCDGLRYELLMYNGARRSSRSTESCPPPFDINIRAIYPGTVTSPGYAVEKRLKHKLTYVLEESDPEQTVEEAVAAALRGLERGRYMTPTNWLGEVMRISALGDAPRDRWFQDTFGPYLTSLAWTVIGPDMNGKAWGVGKEQGMPDGPP